MKEIARNALFMLYTFTSLAIVGVGLVWIYPVGMGSVPAWTCWIVYPLVILVMSSSDIFHRYFDKEPNNPPS